MSAVVMQMRSNFRLTSCAAGSMKGSVMNRFVSLMPGCGLAAVAGLSAFASASGPAAGDPRPYIYLEGGLPEGAAAAVQVMKEYQYGKLIGMSVTIRLFGKTAFLSLPGEASYQSPPAVPAEAPPAGASAAHTCRRTADWFGWMIPGWRRCGNIACLLPYRRIFSGTGCGKCMRIWAFRNRRHIRA
ncbi:hypothetical protein AC781_06805 [Akkermansia glycaniphila]|nr:hypothetical protein AC781_06805 [Akkermansia glycaniphila]